MSCLHNRPGFLYSLLPFSFDLQVDMFAQIGKMSYLTKFIPWKPANAKHCTKNVQCFKCMALHCYHKHIIGFSGIHTFRQFTESLPFFSSGPVYKNIRFSLLQNPGNADQPE